MQRRVLRIAGALAIALSTAGCSDRDVPADGGTSGDLSTVDLAGHDAAGTVACDPAKVTCKSLPATACGIGEVRAISGQCWGECVAVERCNDVPARPNCDLSGVSCEMVTPNCQQGYVPTAEAAACYGPCVPIGTCACGAGGPATQCPDGYICHQYAGRCGPLDQ